MPETQALIPVTVLGGYLGSGKTTLINELLRGGHGLRLAVLVNDFGAINIDAELIATHDGETTSLTNGCVCCSIADALGAGLDDVLAFDPQPDHIIIEASGAADPGKIAAYGQGWPGCRLDGVFVTADAETIRQQSRDQFVGELVTRQLDRADVVLLTKCDLVDEATLDLVTGWAQDQASGPVIRIDHGRIDPQVLFEHVSPNGDRHIEDSLPDAEQLFAVEVVTFDGPIDRARLERALASWPDLVVRVKGIVDLPNEDGSPLPHVVQRVGRRWSITPSATDPTGRHLVLIAPTETITLQDLGHDLSG